MPHERRHFVRVGFDAPALLTTATDLGTKGIDNTYGNGLVNLGTAFQPVGALPMPGLGTLPADWLDLPLLAAALHKVSRSAAFADCALHYGEPAGDAHFFYFIWRLDGNAHKRGAERLGRGKDKGSGVILKAAMAAVA